MLCGSLSHVNISASNDGKLLDTYDTLHLNVRSGAVLLDGILCYYMYTLYTLTPDMP